MPYRPEHPDSGLPGTLPQKSGGASREDSDCNFLRRVQAQSMTPDEAIKEIMSLFTHPGSPLMGEDALARVRECCYVLRQAETHRKDKIREIESWAPIFYSERKWEKYPGGQQSIAGCVLTACRLVEADLNDKRARTVANE